MQVKWKSNSQKALFIWWLCGKHKKVEKKRLNNIEGIRLCVCEKDTAIEYSFHNINGIPLCVWEKHAAVESRFHNIEEIRLCVWENDEVIE